MNWARQSFHWLSALAFLCPQPGHADRLVASARAGPWEARVLSSASASKLQLWQSIAGEAGTGRLVLENSNFLPPALSRDSGEFRLTVFNIAGERLEISVQDHPATTRAYMQRDFDFDLSKPIFLLSFFRTVTYREETAGWLEVDFQTARARQCNEAPSGDLNQCEPRPVKLQPRFVSPSLTDMGPAFSYSAPLLLRVAY